MSITDSTTVSTTPRFTTTISPYVQEIYKTSFTQNQDDTEQHNNRNHHSKFKKKHRKHHKKHHAPYLPDAEYYSHSFSPTYHNSHRTRNHFHHHGHHSRRPLRPHHALQYGTEQTQAKDDGQQFRSGYRANYGSDQYRGRISFYDKSNKLETREDANRQLNGYVKDKYPYFNKVKHHLEEEKDDLPPYLKKYNRRNKQLMDLLEGTLPPEPPTVLRLYHAHRKNPHWLEEDMFEEQKPSKNKWSTEIEATRHPNALPGDGVHVIYEKQQQQKSNSTAFNLTLSSIASNNHSPPFKISSRAGQFVYHTVTQSPSANNSPGSGSSYGSVKKKRLPFVAITDRKIGPPKSHRLNSMNSNSE